MKKKLLIILPIVVVLLAAGYLFGIPAMQQNGYKSTAKSDQLALSNSAAKAISAASQNAFLSQSTTVAEAKNAVKVSKDAATDLETKIQSNEGGLTSFNELPLIAAVNPGYKATAELRTLEGKYVQASKDYLAEFKAVNKYNDQMLPMLEVAEQFPAISDKLGAAQSPEELSAALDEFIGKLNEAVKIASAVKPADSVKEQHEFGLKSLRDLTTLMTQLKTALQAMDLEKIFALSTQITNMQASFEKEDKQLSVKLVEQSKLTKLGDALNDLNKQIDLKTAKL